MKQLFELNGQLRIKTTLLLFVFMVAACSSKTTNSEILISFNEKTETFTDQEKQLIMNIITDSEKEVRKLLPSLPNGIKVEIEIVDWDLEMVGGVTGRAESNTPPLVLIQVSNKFPGGIVNAVNIGLRSTIYHEFHHLSIGWAIKDNKFRPDIKTAAVIEGLAEVFAEEYTGVKFEENHIPEGIDGDEWVKEILALPRNADYQTWMFQHPDGRTSIGYRTGNYLIRNAIVNSNKTIIELSNYSVEKVLEIAGWGKGSYSKM